MCMYVTDVNKHSFGDVEHNGISRIRRNSVDLC